MANITINVARPKNPDDGSYVLQSASWEIASYPDFNVAGNIINSSYNDTVNLIRYVYPTATDKPLYGRVKFHYSNGTSTGWSTILVLRPDQNTPAVTNFIVETPKVSLASTANNELNITSTPFVMFAGTGTHYSTDYYIRSVNDVIVHSDLNNTVDKNSLNVPYTVLKNDTFYLVQVIHTNDSGIKSLVGEKLFKNDLVNTNYFNVVDNTKLYSNSNMYVNIKTYTSNYASADVILIDKSGTTIASNLDQTVTNLSIPTPQLSYSESYTVKVRIKLTDNTYSSYVEVYYGLPMLEDIVTRDQYVTYLDKFNNTDNINLNGMTVQTSNESVNGRILVAKQNDNNIYSYIRYRGLLSEIKPVITMDTINASRDNDYINIIQLPDGDVILDYDAMREIHSGSALYDVAMTTTTNLTVVTDGEDIVKYRPRFDHYSYDKATDTYALIGSVIRDDEILGTSPGNSAVYLNGSIYYLPAMQVTSLTDEVLVDIDLKKLDINTLAITTLKALPIAGIKSYPNLTIIDNKTLMFANGSTIPVQNTVYTSNLTNNSIKSTRVNNNIYKYDVVNNTFTVSTTTPVTVADDNYSYQSFLRKDKKIVMFNSVDSGSELGIQNTLVYNPITDTCIEIVNDTPDTLVFRNTIQLQNGDFLRMSTRAQDPQTVDTYVSDTYDTAQIVNNVTISSITSLTIQANQSITVQDPYRYDTIDILGTGPTDTGTLNWLDGEVMKVYQVGDLLVPNSRSVAGTTTYNSITLLPNAVLTFT